MSEAERAFEQWAKDRVDSDVIPITKLIWMAAWQKATERAAKIVEEADWQPIALLGKDGLNNLSKAIRQQESAE